jgi:DNA (cytosine-5)-methyltransferase 1
MGKKNTKEALADETNQLVNSIIEYGIDCIIGGFPCQDISSANTTGGGAAGLAGSRSGLFWEMVRTVCLVRPKYWLMENVAALFQSARQADMGIILGAVAASGYDCQWDCVAASTVGAPHHRARAFILAYDPSLGVQRLFPKEIRRQPEYSKYEDCRTVQDILRLPNHPEPLLRRRVDGTYPRLHGIGNGNPPCIIREIMKGL